MMISPAVCLVALLAAPPAGAAPEGGRPAYNVPFEGLKKSLLAEGWRVDMELPHFAARTIKGIREGKGKVRALPSKPVLTFSWVTLARPYSFPPGKRASVTYSQIRRKTVETTFVLTDGRTNSFDLSAQPDRFTESGGSRATRETGKNMAQKLVFLQGVVELVDGGKVVRRWYLPQYAIVAFDKEEKGKEK